MTSISIVTRKGGRGEREKKELERGQPKKSGSGPCGRFQVKGILKERQLL